MLNEQKTELKIRKNKDKNKGLQRENKPGNHQKRKDWWKKNFVIE